LRIIQVGIYPPPYGGVSNHLKRLLEYLQIQGKDCLLIDLSEPAKDQKGVVNYSWRKTLLFLLRSPRSIVHFHNFSLKNTFFFFLLSFRHITVLSFHNERFLEGLSAHGRLWRTIAVFFLNRVHYIVVDSHLCKKLAEKIIRDETKIVVIPEFIPPPSVPPLEDEHILRMRREHRYLLASNAFQLSFYKGQDLYGLDILVDLLNRLVYAGNLDVGMVFLLPNIGDLKYFEHINHQVKKLNLSERFLIVTQPLAEAASLWQTSDAVIRATNTDGNSLTVLEALSLKVPVIASDCVERPAGVVLFETRNVEDLQEKVTQVLLNLEQYRQRLEDIIEDNNAATFLKLYENIAGTAGQ
jgi:glycosyltransferase involved in cell wall biosynthesis